MPRRIQRDVWGVTADPLGSGPALGLPHVSLRELQKMVAKFI